MYGLENSICVCVIPLVHVVNFWIAGGAFLIIEAPPSGGIPKFCVAELAKKMGLKGGWNKGEEKGQDSSFKGWLGEKSGRNGGRNLVECYPTWSIVV